MVTLFDFYRNLSTLLLPELKKIDSAFEVVFAPIHFVIRRNDCYETAIWYDSSTRKFMWDEFNVNERVKGTVLAAFRKMKDYVGVI